MNINDEMAKLMNFEKKDIVKQVACPEPENHPNCMTYHCEVVGRFYVNHEHRIDVEDWNPKEDMNQAMECVDSLGDRYTFKLTKEAGVWRCDIETVGYRGHPQHFNAIGRDKSAPLAICKAILRAKGIEA